MAYGLSQEGIFMMEHAKKISTPKKYKGIILGIYKRNFHSMKYQWNLLSRDGLRTIIIYGNKMLYTEVMILACEKRIYEGEYILRALAKIGRAHV